MTARRAPDASAARFQGSARPTGPGRAVATTRGEASRGPDGADGRVKRNRDSGGRRGEGAACARGGGRRAVLGASGRRPTAAAGVRGGHDEAQGRGAHAGAPKRGVRHGLGTAGAADWTEHAFSAPRRTAGAAPPPGSWNRERREREAGTRSGRAGPGAAVRTAPRAREPGKARYGAVAARRGQRRCRHEPCVMTRRQVNVREFT